MADPYSCFVISELADNVPKDLTNSVGDFLQQDSFTGKIYFLMHTHHRRSTDGAVRLEDLEEDLEAVSTLFISGYSSVVNIFSGASSNDDYLGHSKNHD